MCTGITGSHGYGTGEHCGQHGLHKGERRWEMATIVRCEFNNSSVYESHCSHKTLATVQIFKAVFMKLYRGNLLSTLYRVSKWVALVGINWRRPHWFSGWPPGLSTSICCSKKVSRHPWRSCTPSWKVCSRRLKVAVSWVLSNTRKKDVSRLRIQLNEQ